MPACVFPWPFSVVGGRNDSPYFTDAETEALRPESRSINILEQVTDRTGKPTVLKSDWTEFNRVRSHLLPWWLSGKESACNTKDSGDVGLIPGSARSLGWGHGHPLQYSCLKNPMDRGTQWTTVHGVAKSQLITNTRTEDTDVNESSCQPGEPTLMAWMCFS